MVFRAGGPETAAVVAQYAAFLEEHAEPSGLGVVEGGARAAKTRAVIGSGRGRSRVVRAAS